MLRVLIQLGILDVVQNRIQHICVEEMTAALGKVSGRLRIKGDHDLTDLLERLFGKQSVVGAIPKCARENFKAQRWWDFTHMQPGGGLQQRNVLGYEVNDICRMRHLKSLLD